MSQSQLSRAGLRESYPERTNAGPAPSYRRGDACVHLRHGACRRSTSCGSGRVDREHGEHTLSASVPSRSGLDRLRRRNSSTCDSRGDHRRDATARLEQGRLLGPASRGRRRRRVGDTQREGLWIEWTFRLWYDSVDRFVTWTWLKGERGPTSTIEHRHLLDEVSTSGREGSSRVRGRRGGARRLARHGFTKPAARSTSTTARYRRRRPRRLPDGFRYARRAGGTSPSGAIERDVGSRTSRVSYATSWPSGRTAARSTASSRRRTDASPRMCWSGRRRERRGAARASRDAGECRPASVRRQHVPPQRRHEEGMRRAVVGCGTDPDCGSSGRSASPQRDDHLVRAMTPRGEKPPQ